MSSISHRCLFDSSLFILLALSNDSPKSISFDSLLLPIVAWILLTAAPYPITTSASSPSGSSSTGDEGRRGRRVKTVCIMLFIGTRFLGRSNVHINITCRCVCGHLQGFLRAAEPQVPDTLSEVSAPWSVRTMRVRYEISQNELDGENHIKNEEKVPSRGRSSGRGRLSDPGCALHVDPITLVTVRLRGYFSGNLFDGCHEKSIVMEDSGRPPTR
ncbi:hypothetical protein F5141DRAFT_259214 [Pisolithus sp. B1]|nr:hypothetical protein F5141DRAFT_259214 [Pisolithus sp. B1]